MGGQCYNGSLEISRNDIDWIERAEEVGVSDVGTWCLLPGS